MENQVVKAISKNNRMSSFRARLVVDLIRGKKAKEAQAILENLNKKAAKIILKTLNSAIANATFNNKMDLEKLIVSEARVDDGVVYKRIKFDSRGHVGRKDHQTCHIIIAVSER